MTLATMALLIGVIAILLNIAANQRIRHVEDKLQDDCIQIRKLKSRIIDLEKELFG